MASSTTAGSSEIQSPRTSNGTHDTGGSIINRKKELKGLPNSFSSGLGRRASPPSPPRRGGLSGMDCRSVKSIVAWLESASNSAEASKYHREEQLQGTSLTSSSSVERCNDDVVAQRLHDSTKVEECCLTVLNYKKYFTDMPLGRCLDQKENTEMALAITDSNATKEHVLLPCRLSSDEVETNNCPPGHGQDKSNNKIHDLAHDKVLGSVSCASEARSAKLNDVGFDGTPTSLIRREAQEIETF